MIIQCSRCKTKYKVADSKIPQGGLKISCKKCNQIIPAIKEEQEENTKNNVDFLESIVSKTGDLPPMPHIAMKVLELVQNPDTSNEDVRKVISKDQALTAQILKFSNSAMYSCVRTVKTLSDALVILGYNTLKSLVITSSTQAVYERKNKIGLMERKLWEHSIAVAIGARAVGEFIKFPKNEEAFTGGLLHDIGKVILHQGIPEEYDQVVQDVYNSGGCFNNAERERLGFDHTDVGALVVKKWNFAETLESAIHFHHDTTKADAASETLVSIINLADSMANKNKFGLECLAADTDLVALTSTKKLQLTQENITKLEHKILSVLETDREMMNLS